MSRAELLAEASRRGVRGVKDKAKPAIKAALEDAMAPSGPDTVERESEQAAEMAKMDAGVPVAVEPEEDVPAAAPEPAEEGLNPAQQVALQGAATAKIEAVLADPNLRPVWRAAFEAELERRAKLEANSATPYLVVKGGGYVAPGTNYRTNVPKDSVVFEATHNLDDLRAQGIELRAVDGHVVVTENQLGMAVSKLVLASEVGGEAPTPGE